jgi:hypothetical protein
MKNLKKRHFDSAEHKQFLAEISDVMKKHPKASKGLMLANLRNRKALAKVEDDGSGCDEWAVDPVTNEWYCLDPK